MRAAEMLVANPALRPSEARAAAQATRTQTCCSPLEQPP